MSQELNDLFDWIESQWEELKDLPINERWKQFSDLWNPFCTRLHEMGITAIYFLPAEYNDRMEVYYARMRDTLCEYLGVQNLGEALGHGVKV